MLNYETLLSSYDDKLTLMQWLKKVEEALKDASAVAFKVNQRGNATLTFSVEFEDGSELETGPIVLQQGESVQSAEIRNGNLILTLTNGDELDAGNTGAVTGFIINASQHLIVTYQNGSTQDLGAIFNGSISINGNLAVVGDITGPKLDCSIVTGDSIIEKMNGYSLQKNTYTPASDAVFEYIYAGVAKTGNKITFVLAMNVTIPTGSTLTDLSLGFVFCPADVMNALFETNIGGRDVLDAKTIGAFPNAYSSNDIGLIIEKFSTSVRFILTGLQSLTKDTKYFVRAESTFLLGTNLAE